METVKTGPTEPEEMPSVYCDPKYCDPNTNYDDPNNSQACSEDRCYNSNQNYLDCLLSQGPRSSNEKKSMLKQIQERLLKQTKDEVCNMVDDKDQHIKQLIEQLKTIESETEKEIERNEKLDNVFMSINENRDNSKDDDDDSETSTSTDSETSTSTNSESSTSTDSKSSQTKNKRRYKRNKTPRANQEANNMETEIDPHLKTLVNEMNKLKSTLMEYKNQTQILENLRRKSAVRIVDDFDISNEHINKTNKRCHEKNNDDIMKNIMLKKENLLEDIKNKDKEIFRLNERKVELGKENELYREKINEAKQFMKDVQADEIFATDRDEIKMVKNELINKEIEWDDVKYKLNQAKVNVENLKETLEDRQKIVNYYKQKCTQLEETRQKQMESVGDMNDQYNQVIEKLNNDFVAFKNKMCSQVQQYLPLVNQIKSLLNKLEDSDKLLRTTRNSYDDIKNEVNKLQSKIETLNQDIHEIKKRQMSEEDNKKLDNQLFVLENDLEVKKRNYFQLLETNEQIKFDIKQAATEAEEKEKELIQVRLLMQNLQERIAEENQQKISGCENISNTESYLINLQQELKTELNKCDNKLKSKVECCSYENLTNKSSTSAIRLANCCLLDTKLKLENSCFLDTKLKIENDLKIRENRICVQNKSPTNTSEREKHGIYDNINVHSKSIHNLPQGKLEDIKYKMLDVLRKCKTEEHLPIGNRRNIDGASEGLEFFDNIILDDGDSEQLENPVLDSDGSLVVSTLEIM